MEILLLAHRAEELGALEVCVGVLVRGMCAYVCVCVWVCPFIWVITSCPVRGLERRCGNGEDLDVPPR